MRGKALAVVMSIVVAAPSFALPPNERPGFREGANHHLGDDGVIAAELGESSNVSESVRMHDHLVYVHDFLASRPATRPDLEPRRTELLGYLSDYIAKGVTPRNEHLPWRSPVFIDDEGDICAVGYLIERSGGRSLAESIARSHRYDYLEDIAASTPEVSDWVEGSGLSLEELASIQPGYIAEIDGWKTWDILEKPPADGVYDVTTKDGETKGTLQSGRMEGHWSRTDGDGKPIGEGDFKDGAGKWLSTYADGSKLAEGAYRDNLPSGKWRFFHESGNLAAEGTFRAGKRDGAWKFFYDTEQKTPIAVGRFDAGNVSGSWAHYDSKGSVLAVSSINTPPEWQGSFGGHFLRVVPGKDGVRHEVEEGDIMGTPVRLEMLVSGDGLERLYLNHPTYASNDTYDASGHLLEKAEDGGWTSADCGWSASLKLAARSGNLPRVAGAMVGEGNWYQGATCGEKTAVSPARGKRIEAALASVAAVRTVTPDFLKKMILGGKTPEEMADPDAQPDPKLMRSGDLANVLADNMTWYIEWPHVDGRFIQVFHSLPGYEYEF